MSKKRLVTTGVIIALTLVLLIGGMLAFFTDTDTKTNVFTVGDNVEIEVTEVWNSEDGQNIHPGAVVTKEPSIKNNSTTTPAYVFIEVTVPCYASTGTTADRPLYTFTAKEGWELINTPEVDTSTKTITYVYSYSTSGTMTELTPDTTTSTPVFDHVTVEPTLTKEQKDTVSATPDIIINGYGIQTDYLGTSNPAEIFNTIKQEQEAQEGQGGSGNNETTNTVSNETTNSVSNETTNTTTNETQESSSNLVIKNSAGTPINMENVSTYYGNDVSYNEDTYQLFLADTEGKYSNGEPRIWLQRKEYVENVKLNEHFESTGINTDNSVLWQVNPDLHQFKTEIQEKIPLDKAIQGVAYLCNPNNWTATYVKAEDVEKGAYAIGAASVEMYFDSYNEARGVTSDKRGYFEAKAFSKNSTYGYYFKPKYMNSTGNDAVGDFGKQTDLANYQIKTSVCGGMYRNSTTIKQWLSSPNASNTNSVVYIEVESNGFLTGVGTANRFAVRPLISLPANVEIQLSDY